jgi:hypothetical protein
MKTTTLAALLAATALTAASAQADVLFTGDLYVGAGSQTSNEFPANDQDPIFLGGKGSLFVPFENTKLSATIDIFAEHGDGVIDDVFVESDYFSYGGAIHFTYTQGKRYSLGLVGALIGAESPDLEEPDYYLFGAEGKFMLERGAFWGQAGYFDAHDKDPLPDFLTETSFARFGVNYYLEDDLKLAGEIGFYDGQVENNDGAPFSIYRVELEHRAFERVSIYGGYSYLTMDNTDEADHVQSNVFNVGLRFRLGEGDTGTLLSLEQNNSLGVPPVMHTIGLSNRFDG